MKKPAMKKSAGLGKIGGLMLFLIMLAHCIPLSLKAQLPPNVEKAYDEYSQEMVKVYQLAEKETPSVAMERIDEMFPQIERKAKKLVDLAMEDPEAMRVLDSDDSYLLFQDKPFFKEIMRIVSNEEFLEKLETHPELARKLEEAEGIIASYEESVQPEAPPGDGIERGTAFTMSIQGSEFAGKYQIVADFEENAVAYIDDLGYLRIDILGNENGAESSVSFFVENTGEGKQEWATDGHFMFERLNADGDLVFTLWGSEEQGYFEITSVRGPGKMVKGNIQGTCMLGTEESDEEVAISAEFQVKYITPSY